MDLWGRLAYNVDKHGLYWVTCVKLITEQVLAGDVDAQAIWKLATWGYDLSKTWSIMDSHYG